MARQRLSDSILQGLVALLLGAQLSVTLFRPADPIANLDARTLSEAIEAVPEYIVQHGKQLYRSYDLLKFLFPRDSAGSPEGMS